LSIGEHIYICEIKSVRGPLFSARKAVLGFQRGQRCQPLDSAAETGKVVLVISTWTVSLFPRHVPRGPERVMLSYGYWQRRFGGDRTAVGRRILVDARPREIVGAMPQGFRVMDTDFDLIVPTAFDRGKH
jgi:hypothetical protein